MNASISAHCASLCFACLPVCCTCVCVCVYIYECATVHRRLQRQSFCSSLISLTLVVVIRGIIALQDSCLTWGVETCCWVSVRFWNILTAHSCANHTFKCSHTACVTHSTHTSICTVAPTHISVHFKHWVILTSLLSLAVNVWTHTVKLFSNRIK